MDSRRPPEDRPSPEERYASDVAFRQLVDIIEHFIHRAEYTPSEIRDASMLACIRYEMSHVRRMYVRTDEDAVRMIAEGKACLDALEKQIREGE